MKEESIRINKYLSDMGQCSRREADRLLAAGQITVDGQKAELGQRILPGQQVLVKGRPVKQRKEDVLLVFHKPRGVECTARKDVKNNIVEYINYPIRIYPVGRLDKDSEGLILMTNQGDIVNKIMRSGNAHEKEYVVKVNREITPRFLQKMAQGVPILNTVTRPCRIRQTGKMSFCIILTQGMNRQIRRMCEYLGYKVTRLKRVRIMNLNLGDLPPGSYRPVTGEEKKVLYKMIENSSNTTVRYEGEKNVKQTGKNAGVGRASK